MPLLAFFPSAACLGGNPPRRLSSRRPDREKGKMNKFQQEIKYLGRCRIKKSAIRHFICSLAFGLVASGNLVCAGTVH